MDGVVPSLIVCFFLFFLKNCCCCCFFFFSFCVSLGQEEEWCLGCDAGLEMMVRGFEYYKRIYIYFLKLPFPSNYLSYPFLALCNSYRSLLQKTQFLKKKHSGVKEMPKMMEKSVEKMRWVLVWMSRSPWHLLIFPVVLLQTCNATKNSPFFSFFSALRQFSLIIHWNNFVNAIVLS